MERLQRSPSLLEVTVNRRFMDNVKFKQVRIKSTGLIKETTPIPGALKKVIKLIYGIVIIAVLYFGGKYVVESLLCEIRDTPYMTLQEMWREYQLSK